jgi:small conductance mechanosensitive channel
MVLLIFIAAKIVLAVVSAWTERIMRSPRYHKNEQQGKRVNSMMSLTRSVLRYFIYFVAFLATLRQLGFGNLMSNLLVTAGIGSVAIGFGAQSLVKDVVTGFFMMFENQFSVGDYVRVDDIEGTVEATAMRVTYLRTPKGEQVIIPNGSISRIRNYARGTALALVNISTPYDADTKKMMQIILQAAAEYAKQHEELIAEPPYVQGATEFSDWGITIGLACKVQSMKQWEVERGLRLAVKEAFDKEGLLFAHPPAAFIPEDIKKQN